MHARRALECSCRRHFVNWPGAGSAVEPYAGVGPYGGDFASFRRPTDRYRSAWSVTRAVSPVAMPPAQLFRSLRDIRRLTTAASWFRDSVGVLAAVTVAIVRPA